MYLECVKVHGDSEDVFRGGTEMEIVVFLKFLSRIQFLFDGDEEVLEDVENILK